MPSPDAPTAPPGEVTILEPFKRIDVSGSAGLQLVQGTQESVSIAAAARNPSFVEVSVGDDTLFIQASDQVRWWNLLFAKRARPAQIVVTFRNLESIAAAGSVRLSAGEVRVPALRIESAGGTWLKIDNLQAHELKVAGAGAIRAEIAGKVDEQTLSISGAGEYRGADLRSEHASVAVTGAGRVVVNAERTLRATISGAGSVEYLGDPEVTQRVSGAGRVRKREASGFASAPVAVVRQ